MRERRQSEKDSIAGSLLLAHPSLRDPNFRRAVVLMSVHNAEGAMGVVLNRPLGKRLGQLNGEFALGALAGVPLFSGGPVQTEQLLLVAWQNQADGFRLHFGIEPDRAGQLATEEGTELRAFLGYSGWSGGQLEKELKHGESLKIDTGCVVAYTNQINFDIQYVGGIRNTIFGGEGLFFATLTGPGKVWIQTLPISRLASRVLAYGSYKRKEEGSILGGL